MRCSVPPLIRVSMPALLAATLVAALPSTSWAAPAPLPRTECPTIPWMPLSEAHEVINLEPVQEDPENAVDTYKSGGDNEIPDELWPSYVAPDPWLKNSTRNLQFQMSQFIASPGGEICETIYDTTPDGYTWGSMSSAINAMWPYLRDQYVMPSNLGPYFAGNYTLTPAPGDIKITTNYKAQNMEFYAYEGGGDSGTPIMRYFITDQWGNEYIAHATSAETPEELADAFNAAVLPEGWAKDARYLEENLIIRPAEGSDGSFHYLVLRDSADIGYHQISWGREGQLQAQVPDMPVWGGQEDDRLEGYAGPKKTERNLIHGAAGDDRLIPGPRSADLWGDAGLDIAVLPGRWGQYRVVSASQDGSDVQLAVRLDGKWTFYSLNYIEVVKVNHKRIKTVDLRTP